MAMIHNTDAHFAIMEVSFPTISGHRARKFKVKLADLPNASAEERAFATVDAAMRNRNMMGITEIHDHFPKDSNLGPTSFDGSKVTEGFAQLRVALDELRQELRQALNELKATFEEIIRILKARDDGPKSKSCMLQENYFERRELEWPSSSSKPGLIGWTSDSSKAPWPTSQQPAYLSSSSMEAVETITDSPMAMVLWDSSGDVHPDDMMDLSP